MPSLCMCLGLSGGDPRDNYYRDEVRVGGQRGAAGPGTPSRVVALYPQPRDDRHRNRFRCTRVT